MLNLGESFIEGRCVNLNKVEISDLESYLKTIKDNKKNQKEKLENFLEELYS